MIGMPILPALLLSTLFTLQSDFMICRLPSHFRCA
jgi:hypothetical protein